MSADERYLTLCARRNRTATPALLRSSLAATTRKLVSTSTVRRRLHEKWSVCETTSHLRAAHVTR
ncbi:hypothetical protein X975_12966, partial [Stegodyphus mimosarum]